MVRVKQRKLGGPAVAPKRLAAGSAARGPAPPQPAAGARRRRRPGMLALHEIRKFQRSTELLIRRLPFARVVKEICDSLTVEPMRWQVRVRVLFCGMCHSDCHKIDDDWHDHVKYPMVR